MPTTCRVKVRQQLLVKAAPSSSTAPAASTNWLSVLVRMVRTEGVLAPYKGLSASMLREASYSGIRMGSYDAIKRALSAATTSPSPAATHEHRKEGVAIKLGAGMISGIVGAGVANPADLVSLISHHRQQHTRAETGFPVISFVLVSSKSGCSRRRLKGRCAPRSSECTPPTASRASTARSGPPPCAPGYSRAASWARTTLRSIGPCPLQPLSLSLRHCTHAHTHTPGRGALVKPVSRADDGRRRRLLDEMPRYFDESLRTHFAASGIAGFVCSAASNPGASLKLPPAPPRTGFDPAAAVDVVKVRLMNDRAHAYRGALHCTASLLANEGPLALYKGFTMCWLRLWPHSVVSLLAFEKLRQVAGLRPI